MMTQTHLHCPNCHQVDGVQKATALVNTGIVSSTYRGFASGVGYIPNGPILTGNNIALSGTSQTALSSLLSPPLRPRPYKNYLGLYIFLSVLSVLLPFLFQSTFIISFSICALIALTILIYYEKRDLPTKRSGYAAAINNWQRAMDKWNHLYYCHRCDGVFLPGQNLIVPSAHMMHYLYNT
jgi:hypothetical protein